MIAAINLAHDAANLILERSAVNLRMRLVFITQTFNPNLDEFDVPDLLDAFVNPSGKN